MGQTTETERWTGAFSAKAGLLPRVKREEVTGKRKSGETRETALLANFERMRNVSVQL